MITRAQVISNCENAWGGLRKTLYSQDVLKNGYRTDCSGFVSMVLGIPASAGWGGCNTVSLVTDGWIRAIPKGDLRPGDLVGICGPGTAGDNGHVVIFAGWSDATQSSYVVYEQAGGLYGPVRRTTRWAYDGDTSGWQAYRFKDITEIGSETMSDYTPFGKPKVVGDRGDSVMLADVWYNELVGFSPYTTTARSYRSALLEEVKENVRKLVTSSSTPVIDYSKFDYNKIADLVAAKLGDVVATKVADEIERRMVD